MSYKGKEIRTRKTGTVRTVPYCNSCHSTNIKTIQYCEDCSSKEIKYPNIWSDNTSPGIIAETKEYEVNVYYCDKCGKEFDSYEDSNVLTHTTDGDIVGYRVDEDSTYDRIYLTGDICPDCKKRIVDELIRQQEIVFSTTNIEETIEKLFGEEKE